MEKRLTLQQSPEKVAASAKAEEQTAKREDEQTSQRLRKVSAAVKAVDTIDICLGRLMTALDKAGGVMLLTADHGNIEMMQDPGTAEPYTAHTTLDVPIIAFGAPPGTQLTNGRLADVAPTLLELMGLAKPQVMSGHSLLVKGA